MARPHPLLPHYCTYYSLPPAAAFTLVKALLSVCWGEREGDDFSNAADDFHLVLSSSSTPSIIVYLGVRRFAGSHTTPPKRDARLRDPVWLLLRGKTYEKWDTPKLNSPHDCCHIFLEFIIHLTTIWFLWHAKVVGAPTPLEFAVEPCTRVMYRFFRQTNPYLFLCSGSTQMGGL